MQYKNNYRKIIRKLYLKQLIDKFQILLKKIILEMRIVEKINLLIISILLKYIERIKSVIIQEKLI